MKKPIESINRLLHIDGSTVKALDVIDSVPRETLVKTLTYVISQLEDLSPEEGGEKCSKENGMMICHCGKCKPEDYPLPVDFPKPSEEWEERFRSLFPDGREDWKKGKLHEFIRSEKEASYDQGAAEASRVCNDITSPKSYQKGREDMKAEVRKRAFSFNHQGSEEYEKGYNAAVKQLLS